MSLRKVLAVLLTLALLVSSSLFSSIVFGAQESSIELQLDKTNADVGEIITATLSVNNISNFAGYHVNLKYDPEVLQPIKKTGEQYTTSTNPESGTLLNNSDFGVLPQASNNLKAGTLNFGKIYTNLEEYRTIGNAETVGSVAVMTFKVIAKKPTSIVFEDTNSMPNALTGTNIFDWYGNKIESGYTVVQSGLINSDNQNPITESNISLVYDKTSAKVGETVKVSLKVNNLAGFAGYQVNLKYDPNVLQPITAAGNPYKSTTNLTGGDMFNNADYSPFYQSLHDFEQGILNFSASYMYLEEYKTADNAETSGTLGVVEFKVLNEKATTVCFEDTNRMPNAISGTLLLDWNVEKILGYKVNQAGIFNEDGSQFINGNISLDIDKVSAEVGDIINATIEADNISDFAGYQVNISYDPTILKPITEEGEEYTKNTLPKEGDLLTNNDYKAYSLAAHNLSAGTLNFGKSYTNLEAYKKSGIAETKGTLAVISFQVLKAEATSILFENSASMPNGISGTLMFDWNGDRILSGYTVNQAPIIKITDPTGIDKKTISLNLDKSNVSVGDIITAALKADGIENLAGFQVSIKYDPQILQPVNASTGEAYGSNTNPETGDLINNSSFSPVPFAGHDLKSGILSFARSYINLEAYRNDKSESSGTLAKISFKVLKEKLTYIKLKNTSTIPSAIEGTMLFDWNANKITSGYDVVQPEPINQSALTEGNISIEVSKPDGYIGSVIDARIYVNNIDNLSGFQANLKYDPQVLKPVYANGKAYTSYTIPEAGEILSNEDFGLISVASNDIDNGILNFSKFYTDIQAYKNSGVSENGGVVAIVSFEILSFKSTTISFENSNKMPNGISGTMLFNWDGERIKSGYQTTNAYIDTGYGSTSHCVRTPPYTITPTPTIPNVVTPDVTPTTTPEVTSEVTPQVTPEVTPEVTDVIAPTPTVTICVPTPTNDQTVVDSFIKIEFNKTNVKVNDTITATVMVNNINNFAGYQVNMKYNPDMLQPITSSKAPYKNGSIPSNGTLLSNADYGIISAASHKVAEGILNFGKAYTNLKGYEAEQTLEQSGSIAVVTFKVIAEGKTSIGFANSASMPNAISGTILFDWFGNKIKQEYKVVQAEDIYINPSDNLPIQVVTPTNTSVVTPTPVVTVTNEPVVTPTTVVTITNEPVATPTPTSATTSTIPVSSSYITLDFDKTELEVGETVKATVRVNELSNLAGYQINLEYDPEVLQPVKKTGVSYTNGTIPSSGTLIENTDYGPINAVSHTLNHGQLNFGKLYTVLEAYKASGSAEETGTLAVIEFKVLKAEETSINFKNSSTMPNGINGTMLFDWNGERITSGYSVVQTLEIN